MRASKSHVVTGVILANIETKPSLYFVHTDAKNAYIYFFGICMKSESYKK